MFDQLYPEKLNNSLNQSVLRPEDEAPTPGFLTGVGSALIYSVPYTANTMASYAVGAYAIGQRGMEEYNNASMKKQPSLRGDILGASGTDETAKQFRQSAENWKPDPSAVGIAGQVVHGVASSLIKAGAYTLTTGPAAPVMFGLDLGVNRQQELMDQGVDPETAANAGGVSTIAGFAGLKVAPALGATRLQSAAIGASINPLMTVGEIGGIHAILEHADYPKIAAQYDAFDPMAIAVSALTGGAFGAAFHQGGAKLSPDEHAAALLLNEAQTRDADALTPRGDINAANAAADEQGTARQALDAGQPVEVNGALPIDGTAVDEIQSSVRESFVKGQEPIIETITAYHGSPHQFDTFSSDKIGTGEGAQAFGHGLYFTESEGIADGYRTGLTANDFINKAKDSYDETYSPQDAEDSLLSIDGLSEKQKDLIKALKNDDWLGFDYPHQAISEALLHPKNWDLSPETLTALKDQGSFHKVSLSVSKDKMLDWYQSIYDQGEKVNPIINKLLADNLGFKGSTGGDLYKFLVKSEKFKSDKEVSSYLESLGIEGVKYKADKGKSDHDNLVVFNDKNISITNGKQEPEYHPAISSLASELEKGGGIAYAFDEHGTITGRTPSVNPDWYKDGAFKILGKDGEELKTSPTVQDIKTAVDRYNAGEKITSRQKRILSALSDVAKGDEDFHNSQFSEEQRGLAHEISTLVEDAQGLGLGKVINDAIARGDLNSFDDVMSWRDDINDMIAERNIAKQDSEQPITDSTDNTENASADTEPTAEPSGFMPETPEQVGAMNFISKNPDAVVRFEGQDYKASDLMNEAAADEAQSKTDATAFEAAITCAMRFMS
jgi:hypothetical protein